MRSTSLTAAPLPASGARGKAVALLSIFLIAACATTTPAPAPGLDLRIIHARVVDGTGAPWYRADVGVRGDTIVAIGDLGTVQSKITIDAGGNVVAPGFIDLLGQSQDSVLIDPHLEGKVRQGVTTEVTGEGDSPGPSNVNTRDNTSNNDNPGYWPTLGAYLDTVEKRGTALNFALLVGATNPRSMVIGAVNREATEEELQRMEAIVARAMRDGAIGISTSLIYVPAVFSTTEEIIRLARVAAIHGGVYFTHLRSEADRIDSALDEAFRIGREAAIPVNIWHLKIGGMHNWGRMPRIVAKIAEEREAGLDIAANVYPYIASATGLSQLVPDWALEGGYQAFLGRLRDRETRLKIADEIRGSSFYRRINGAHGALVTTMRNPAMKQYERKRLDEIGAMMKIDPIDAALLLMESVRESPTAMFFSMNEEDVKVALKQPWVSVGADSGAVVGAGKSSGAHPRAYGTFPRVVGHYVRDEKLFSMEEAVRKITSQAASRAHIFDRGVIRPGMKADLVVFDPATIRDLATYEDPHHYSEGISDVIVNGVPVLREGKMTDALPGRILRGPAYVK